MNNNDKIFNRIAEALLCDYASVYYVNTVTNEYVSYSGDPEFRSLKLRNEGSDFFRDLEADIDKVVCSEDMDKLKNDMSKEKLMKEMKNGTMRKIVYRLMIDGRPVYHSLRLIRQVSGEDEYFILGVSNVDNEVRIEQESAKLEKERRIYNQIARSLASYYDTIYYVDSVDDQYIEISASTEYDELNIPKTGDDFFSESRKNIKKFILPEDRERVLKAMQKQHIFKTLENKKLFKTDYRLLIGGDYKYTRMSIMWAEDKRHLIIGVEDIDERYKADLARKELEAKSKTYIQMLNSLAYRYDSIYYIDIESGNYYRYGSQDGAESFVLEHSGVNFFADAERDIETLIYKDDMKVVKETVSKENIMKRLDGSNSFSQTYRQLINGNYAYVSLRITWAEDKRHIIMGLVNIDEKVRREVEYRRELVSANEKAMHDQLTGVKNKNAYQMLESSVQNDINEGKCKPFAVLICDLNDLKKINDTFGHKAGDRYIQSACKLICRIFAHSPVFRIGGDEFAVLLRDHDYISRSELFTELRREVRENCDLPDAPVIASGIADYDPLLHSKVSEVFELADSRMYENKKELKQLG